MIAKRAKRANTSSFGLGAFLLRKQSTGDMKPVAYIADTNRGKKKQL